MLLSNKNKQAVINEKPQSRIRRLLMLIPALISITLLIIALTENNINKNNIIYIIVSFALIAVSVYFALFPYHLYRYAGWTVLAVTPIASCLLLEFYTHNPFKMSIFILLLNVGLFFILTAFIFALTSHSAVAITVTALLPMIFGLVNYYTLQFRNTPIFPWDFKSISTAVSVADNYSFNVTFKLATIISGFMLLILLGLRSNFKINISKKWLRVTVSTAFAVVMLFYTNYLQADDAVYRFGLYKTLFRPVTMYQTNGLAVSFFSNLKYLEIDKPKGYSTEALHEIMNQYYYIAPADDTDNEFTTDTDPDMDYVGRDEPQKETPDTTVSVPDITPPGDSDFTNGDQPVNVIVIMNETFSDLSVLGDFTTNKDYLPFINSLNENTVKGNLYVSIKGGNTANSEFEFLTGSSMAFLPMGSIPYQQYINNTTPTLVSQFSSMGYKTISMHPYYAPGWERDEVYKHFGFDQSYFIDDFDDSVLLRKYIPDLTTYKKIIELYENKTPGEKMFVFDVTMQNHGSYTDDYDNFIPEITINGLEDKALLTKYMSLMYVSDEALKELITYFEAQDERTVIVMFGDHQPNDNVVEPIYELNGVDSSKLPLNEQQNRYVTPFLIWANYDIEEKTVDAISCNYLSTYMLETLGFELTPHQQFLRDLRNEYPVINAYCYMDKNGEFYTMPNNFASIIGLNNYTMLQYNYLFDEKTILEYFNLKRTLFVD